jgi:hypothetical protein
MKKLLALLLVAGSVSAFAMDNPLYLGVGAGAGWNTANSPATTFRMDGGYMWTPNWSAEIGTTKITQSGGQPNQGMQYYDASIKGTVNLGDVVGLFLQVGGAYGDPSVPDNSACLNSNNAYCTGSGPQAQAGWNFLTGVGVNFNLTQRVSLNVSDLYYYGAPNPQGNSDVALVGVNVAF